ncbi:hypothetical protein PT974_11256 [Cladobotryum mycophilum]|uniref:Uncharacterized protein n=1 Tax=Cladobotryum mycophilum TaxID=491253 RepID=A0ABR0S4Q0_9HYPO
MPGKTRRMSFHDLRSVLTLHTLDDGPPNAVYASQDPPTKTSRLSKLITRRPRASSFSVGNLNLNEPLSPPRGAAEADDLGRRYLYQLYRQQQQQQQDDDEYQESQGQHSRESSTAPLLGSQAISSSSCPLIDAPDVLSDIPSVPSVDGAAQNKPRQEPPTLRPRTPTPASRKPIIRLPPPPRRRNSTSRRSHPPVSYNPANLNHAKQGPRPPSRSRPSPRIQTKYRNFEVEPTPLNLPTPDKPPWTR